jgi:hypothetical protein
MATYYLLKDDVFVEGRWHLNGLYDANGVELDCRDFTYGSRIEIDPYIRVSSPHDDRIIDAKRPLKLFQSKEGRSLDFTFTDLDMPVVTVRIGMLLGRIADLDIQRIPVFINGDGHYEIINVVSRVECIDTKRSEIMWWEKDNDIRPDLAGTPQMITKLLIDSSRVGGHHIFRPEGWDLAVIVSDILKTALETEGVSGIIFHDVS